MTRLHVDVPATSANLGPGFDSLGMALDVADTYLVELDAARTAVEMDEATSTAAGVAPNDHYACRAYRAYAADAGVTLPGAGFVLEGRIPVGRGFGSSAAAIVAGLAAAAHAAGEKEPNDRLLRLAARLEGHPDNSSAAVLGGVTVAFCDGDLVFARPVVTHLSCGIAFFVPDAPLRTVEARAVLPREVPVSDAVFNLSRSAYLVAALTWGRTDEITAAMDDRLHQPHRSALIPGMQPVIGAAVAAGAYGAALSGGGPSIVALGPVEAIEAVAVAMEATARAHDWSGHSIVTAVRARGVQVTEEKGPEAPA